MAKAPRNHSTPTRPRDAHRTKTRILAAAQDLFATHGYARTGLRDIACKADVAVSLLPQHFGSKAELFEAALVDSMGGYTLLDVPKAQWGRAMIDYVSGGSNVRLAAMVILSTGDAEARDITARIIRDRIMTELAARLGPPDARARALQITMLGTGFLLYGRQLPIGPIDQATCTRFAQWLQAIVDGSEA